MRTTSVYYLFSVFDRVYRDLSSVLKNRGTASRFSGMAYAKVPELADAIFESVTFISDWQPESEIDFQFLSRLEHRYSVTISEMIHADRHMMRMPPQDRLPLAQWILRRFLTGMQTHQVNLIIAEGLDDFISFFAQQYAHVENIGFVYPVVARMGANVFLSNTKDTGPKGFETSFEAHLNQFKSELSAAESINTTLATYIKAKEQPIYVKKSAGLLFKVGDRKDFKIWGQLIKRFILDRKGFHYNVSPFRAPLNRILKITRALRYWGMMRRKAVELNRLPRGRYFIYPIHFHPEAATLIQGRHFNDQIRIVEMISKALPADVTLVIKEHKVNIGRHPLSFYRRLSEFHNVAFVSENIDVYALISGAIGTITISSSMGLETMMLGKPVLAFGDVFYTRSKNVIKAHDITQMKSYIQSMITHSFDPVDRSALFAAMHDHFVQMGRMNPDNPDYYPSLNAFADALERFHYLNV